uniref:Tudor domain-containing protein n=1 Tax=Caenorhabditis tropicalis TaxID=1561998 RepID=A0A1I7T1Z9_9PELO
MGKRERPIENKEEDEDEDIDDEEDDDEMEGSPNGLEEVGAFDEEEDDDFVIRMPDRPTSYGEMTSIRWFHEPDNVATHNAHWENFLANALNGNSQETRHICPMFNQSKAPLKWLFINEGAFWVSKVEDFPEVVHPVELLRAGGYYEHDIAVRLYLRANGEEKIVEASINWPDLVRDSKVVHKTLFSSWKNRFNRNDTFLFDLEEFTLAKKYLNTPVCNLIKVGHYFELQLEESPIHVVYAKVIKNYDGWMLVEFGKNFRWVHMFNPHCHALGWQGKQAKNEQILDSPLKYITKEGALERYVERPVTPFVFRNNGFEPHGFELDTTNVLVVYLDIEQRNFYLAHVIKSRQLSKHFFHLAIGDYVLQYNPQTPMFFHINHERIFGYETVKQLGVKIHLPPSIVLKKDQTEDSAYIMKFLSKSRLVKHFHMLDTTHTEDQRQEIAEFHNIHARKTVDVRDRFIGVERSHMGHLSQLTKDEIYKKMDSLKFVEIFRMSNIGVHTLTAAEVVRQTKSILVLKVDGEDEGEVYAHMNDPHVFPVGSGVNMKLAVEFWSTRAETFPNHEE